MKIFIKHEQARDTNDYILMDKTGSGLNRKQKICIKYGKTQIAILAP